MLHNDPPNFYTSKVLYIYTSLHLNIYISLHLYNHTSLHQDTIISLQPHNITSLHIYTPQDIPRYHSTRLPKYPTISTTQDYQNIEQYRTGILAHLDISYAIFCIFIRISCTLYLEEIYSAILCKSKDVNKSILRIGTSFAVS